MSKAIYNTYDKKKSFDKFDSIRNEWFKGWTKDTSEGEIEF